MFHSDKKVALKYDPARIGKGFASRDIQVNGQEQDGVTERLIGVYGVRGKKWFTSFGFLVLV